MSWVYRSVTKARPNGDRGDLTTFHVGFLSTERPTGLPVLERFNTVETYTEKDDARRAVHYLNGGMVP